MTSSSGIGRTGPGAYAARPAGSGDRGGPLAARRPRRLPSGPRHRHAGAGRKRLRSHTRSVPARRPIAGRVRGEGARMMVGVADVERFRRGERVVYVGQPVFDGIIRPGDTGAVVKVEPGWVFALWSSGVHSVPPATLRHQATLPPRQLDPVPGDPAWALVGRRLPAPPDGRPRDPYWEQGQPPRRRRARLGRARRGGAGGLPR